MKTNDNLPVIDLLRENKDSSLPFHMPGHKRNTYGDFAYLKELGAELDITEIEGFDDLNSPEGLILKSEKRASELWGSKRSHYLVNGSTQGLLAALHFAAKHGRSNKIICARNCHKSVYNAIMISGAKAEFILPDIDELTGTYGEVNARSVKEMLIKNPDAAAVVVTSPTYEGVVSDIESISAVCKEYSALLIVDEAHGSHLNFDKNRKSSVKYADIAVQSLHKTLPSLTQTAILHENLSQKEGELLKYYLTAFGTSSPSYLFIASIDSCVRLLNKKGGELIEKWKERNRYFFSRTDELNRIKVINPFKDENTVRDFSKIVILSGRSALSGEDIASLLRDRNIEPEMVSEEYVIAMTGAGDNEANLARLAGVLRDIDMFCPCRAVIPKTEPYSLPEKAYEISEALYMPSEKRKDFDTCIGKISASFVWAYPPGIPYIVPGEIFDENIVARLKKAASRGVKLYSKPCGLCTLK